MNEYDTIFGKHFGVGIQRGFNGEVQFNRNGKVLSGKEHSNLLTNYSKAMTKARNEKTIQGVTAIVQALDPSGISNYKDTYETLKSNKPVQEKAFSVLGALPMFGKLETPLKLSKGTLKGEKALNALEKTSKFLDKITPRTPIDTKFEGLTQKVYNQVKPNATKGFVTASKIPVEDKLNLLFSGSNIANKTGDLLNMGEAGSDLYDSYTISQQMQEMKNKNKKKFAYGGTAMDIDSPSEDLSKIRRMSDDARAESMNDPLVSGLKMLGTTMINKGFSMVGSGMSSQGDMDGVGGFLQDNLSGLKSVSNTVSTGSNFATGGTVMKPSEVEGEEVAELPDGTVGEFSGPSHGEGGIPIDLPSGTDIYSKRVKVNGETMADRKLIREKQLDKFQKLFDKNPLDKNLQSTLGRIKSNNSTLDNKDMMIQNALHELHNSSKRALGGTIDDEDYDEEDDYLDDEESIDEEPLDYDYDVDDESEEYEEGDYEEEFATGGTIDPYGDEEYDDLINKYPIMSNRGMENTYLDSQDMLNPVTLRNNNSIQPIDIPNSNPQINNNKNTSSLGNITGNLSMGDMIGMGGQLYGAFAGRSNTLANRRGDTPNINPYKDYGKEGLETAKRAKDSLGYTRDLSLQDLERSRNSMQGRARNSARGINTLRALNLVTDSSVNSAKNKVFSDYGTKMSGMLLQEANMQNNRDRMVMSGEGQRDMNDRKDRDNFYSQLGQDKQSIAQGITNFGGNMNRSLERDLTTDALSALSKYFDSEITADGFKLTNKKKK